MMSSVTSVLSEGHRGTAPFISRYGTGAIAVHWTMAILVAFLGSQSYLSHAMSHGSRGALLNLHIGVGVVVAVLLIGRIAWRATHRPHELPDETTPFVRISALAVHMLLYATMLFVVVVGLVNVFSRGHGIDFGIFHVPPLMAADRAITRPINRMHSYSAYFLLTLAGAHMLAALWHHFVARDTILLRMWPARRN
jgi:cytochrome b561